MSTPRTTPARVAGAAEDGPRLRRFPGTVELLRRARELGLTVRANDARLPPLHTISDGARTVQVLQFHLPLNPLVGSMLARSKPLTRRVLRSAGVPMARGGTFRTQQAADAFRRTLATAVVVKPIDSLRGRGVTTGVTSRAKLRAAFASARRYSAQVLVEEQVRGPEQRLTVLDGQLIAAHRYEPVRITGDGTHTLQRLIRRFDRTRGGDLHGAPRRATVLDRELRGELRRQGFGLMDVPAAGVTITLRADGFLSRDGLITDITEQVHPEVVALASRAAAALDLRLAGLDVIGDVTRAPRAGSLRVIEVNDRPDLKLHAAPDRGTPRDVYGAVLRALFPALPRTAP